MRQQITYYIEGVKDAQFHTIDHPEGLSLDTAEKLLKLKLIPFFKVSSVALLDVDVAIDNLLMGVPQ